MKTKTNSAFVFIKPHACKGTPGAVESVVETKFKESGIRVTGSGELLAETIDKEQYIGKFQFRLLTIWQNWRCDEARLRNYS